MAVPPPPSGKPALRAALREARMRFVHGPALGADGDAAIRERLRPLLARAGPLAGFIAIGGEPDVMPLLRDAAAAGHPVALPRIDADRMMSFAAWRPDLPLTRGPFGISQPAAAEVEVEPAILLVPLVGFDRSGARLGRGGGHYDRWFAAHPRALRIGVAWSVQEVATLPVDEWDVPLHAVVTEQEWIAF